MRKSINTGPYIRRFEIDAARRPVVVFESDDWGACAFAPNPEVGEESRRVLARFGLPIPRRLDGLESPAELDRLFSVLASHKGADGLPPVFTAFTLMANPDFRAIRESGFTEYRDIAPGEGFPDGWNGDGVAEKWREGMERGLWEPEYHGLLHHNGEHTWMALLRAPGRDGDLARALFDLNIYAQRRHLPEYEGLTVREQWRMIDTGFTRFERLFGRMPAASATSCAYPETELLWAVRGARTVCLKNCRVNSGEVVVYPTKPWNMQDVYARMGDGCDKLDVAFLTRNVFWESDNTLEEVQRTIEKVWTVHREPAVISTHRSNYCNFELGCAEERLERLDRLLAWLAGKGAYFLTSAELGDLCRRGWSERRIGKNSLRRKWFENAGKPEWPVGDHLAPSGRPAD